MTYDIHSIQVAEKGKAMDTAVAGKGGNGLQGVDSTHCIGDTPTLTSVIAGADRHGEETQEEKELREWAEATIAGMYYRTADYAQARLNISNRKG